VLLGAGTLYGAINTLLKKKWIAPFGNVDSGSSKKQYVITDLGKQMAEKELNRLRELYDLASKIMGGAPE
jgi:DNA-binding PadR family transcriptional regulator